MVVIEKLLVMLLFLKKKTKHIKHIFNFEDGVIAFINCQLKKISSFFISLIYILIFYTSVINISLSLLYNYKHLCKSNCQQSI